MRVRPTWMSRLHILITTITIPTTNSKTTISGISRIRRQPPWSEWDWPECQGYRFSSLLVSPFPVSSLKIDYRQKYCKEIQNQIGFILVNLRSWKVVIFLVLYHHDRSFSIVNGHFLIMIQNIPWGSSGISKDNFRVSWRRFCLFQVNWSGVSVGWLER